MDIRVTRHPDPSPLAVENLDQTGYEAALAEAQRFLGATPASQLDAVIHNVCVRLHTNNPHWRRFWSANWYTPNQWAVLTGGPRRVEPQVHIYAVDPQADSSPWAGHNRDHDMAFLTGDTPYGSLRALTLGAVARVLAEEEAVHFVKGACLKVNGHGALWLPMPGLDEVTIINTLVGREGAHLVALDGVLIRYGLQRMVDGVTMLPTAVYDEKGQLIRGYRLFDWLEEFGYWEPRADARCLTLQGEDEYCFARDLDLGRAPEAFAYPMERAWYVPTQLVAAQPSLVGPLWLDPEPEDCRGLENVPALTPDLWEQLGAWASEAAASLATPADLSTRALFDEKEMLVEALCRLRAVPEARAMVPPERLWPGRAGGHPWQPLHIEQAILIASAGLTQLDAAALAARVDDLDANAIVLYDEEMARALTNMLGRATEAVE